METSDRPGSAGPPIITSAAMLAQDMADRARLIAEAIEGELAGQHLYEKFLAAYDPALRKGRGVWYTPPPVVNFIVRAIDGLLQKEFCLPDGLADTSTTEISIAGHGRANAPKLQILDPAAGTGAFLAETVRQVFKKFSGREGLWQSHVEQHLIPRLNGFEILMAPYATAHLCLGLLLSETGYRTNNKQDFRIFLANSLEEPRPDTLPSAQFLSNEVNCKTEEVIAKTQKGRAKPMGQGVHMDSKTSNVAASAASAIVNCQLTIDNFSCFANGSPFNKNGSPFNKTDGSNVDRAGAVLVVMGNPPYAVSSSNKGQWISALLESYKKGLNERNIQPLSDDYIKFMRYGQHLIDKNGRGILAYISNNSFIDGLIHRQMRKSLLGSFDKIYILDLHGNAKRKEGAPDGGRDENVFDIQQGVSINIFVKTGAKTKGEAKAAKVFHSDLWGKRDEKYSFLSNSSLAAVQWSELDFKDDNYFFVPKDYELKDEYETGFRVDELFPINSSGVKTHDDDHLVSFCPFGESNQPYAYRPFDIRNIAYDLERVKRHRYSVMKHFIAMPNIGLVVSRQATTNNWSHVQVTKDIIDGRIHYSNKGIPVSCPLYLYVGHDEKSPNPARSPNLSLEIVKKISNCIGLEFEDEKSGKKNKYAPIDLLDYIYAVLYSPSYREKYIDFLKTNFPRVPYPVNAAEFRRLASIGAELRGLHLMEHPALDVTTVKFPIAGSGTIEKLRWAPSKCASTGLVWINSSQYFDNVPVRAWNFYIGGYQPAQKWLKARRGRTLSHDEITHYQRIVAALDMTDEIMKNMA
jgi:predicted helicase